ncbi:hypothetical protein [Streptosporangium vulgare]|uniref:Uncharacterized protein n=1 Tax=Streptosporangium vulgare TaxID=46190 RepID=A0ABV5T8Q1_9ACTN
MSDRITVFTVAPLVVPWVAARILDRIHTATGPGSAPCRCPPSA